MYLHLIVTSFWHVRRCKHQWSFFWGWTIKTLSYLNYTVYSKTRSRYCILVGACDMILSLPTLLLGGTVLPVPSYFHPAKPSILDNTVRHREDWSEQRGQVLLRIPGVWAVSLGSIKAASCFLSATEHCKTNSEKLSGTLISFEITCILSALLILVQSDHISLIFLGKQFKN